jgi:molybdopterin/thiamine biosynthesis adenylyltransferase
MNIRYSRNFPALSHEDMDKLINSHILVAGCGGLGGYVIEYLARIGVGSLTVVDGDVFTESNLNRQLLCTSDNLGTSKALAAAERIKLIDPSICVTPVCEYLTEANAPALLADSDIVIDCLDSIESRLMLEGSAADAGVYMVHGAISGWDLQAMLIPPGSGLLNSIYADMPEDDTKTSLSFTPAACAALEVSLAIRYLCGLDVPSDGTLYAGSLRDLRFESVGLTTGDE